MRKLSSQIQCADLAVALEEGLAAIDVELGSASDLVVTPGPADTATIPSRKLASDLQQEFLQALDARSDFVKAQVAGDEEGMEVALYLAEICGHNSYTMGSTEAPILLASIPALSEAWQKGWRSATVSEEISECWNCEAARGDPCPHHG